MTAPFRPDKERLGAISNRTVQRHLQMKKVEATIRSFQLDEMREALVAIGVTQMKTWEVETLDGRGRRDWYRGVEYVRWFGEQTKIELLVQNHQVNECIDAIQRVASAEQAPCEIVVVAVEVI